MNRGYYDPDHDPAIGCLAWLLVALVVIILFLGAIEMMTTPDPPGRCSQEPGPNGITISTCEPDN